jgi:DNA-binding HxlR family transcriptional regulator
MTRRSSCPITCSLDLIGDRWTLVIMRDLLLAGKTAFSELASVEGIATNVLSDRLTRLEQAGLIRRERDPADGRRRRYVPTRRCARC